MSVCQVVIDAVIGNDDKIFDYTVPDGMTVQAGMRVLVPFGPKNIEGFVMGISKKTDVPQEKIKAVIKILDDFIAIKPEFLTVTAEICSKFKLRTIDVLRLFVPSPIRGRKRMRVPQNKAIKTIEVDAKQVILTQQQQMAVQAIISAAETYEKSNAQIFVLHGVTGSGKTEVYMNVIEQVLARGQTAIMLVPEIGLTPQVFANFRVRFGEKVAILHSGLTSGERYDEWLRLHEGKAKIAVGARSAVFAPLENIGIIIIDEEHDTSYFSESNPRFHTHEIAKLRCKYNSCPLVLGSATPSIETYFKTINNLTEPAEYKLLRLNKRVNNLQMPAIETVDMASEIRSGNSGIFSRYFIEKLITCIKQGKQAIIFLNRRGFTSFVMCKNCGWVAKCEHCDVSLVYHKDDSRLKCHYCASRFTPVSSCPKCSSTYLKHGATGTQKAVEELEKLFNNESLQVKVFRMDADNTKTKDALIGILDEFGKTKSAVLVGTQMIAKGHHFPNVSLVGIIDADNSLHFSDYRAAERTFALITQVSGRAGREGSVGQVILQTYIPTHYVYRLAANYDFEKFFEKEINTRQITKYPPFTTVVRVLVTGERDDQIKSYLQKTVADLRVREKEFIYIAAMKSPIGRLQNKFRYQILMRFSRQNEKEMIDFIGAVIKQYQAKNLQVFLEINPQSLS